MARMIKGEEVDLLKQMRSDRHQEERAGVEVEIETIGQEIVRFLVNRCKTHPKTTNHFKSVKVSMNFNILDPTSKSLNETKPFNNSAMQSGQPSSISSPKSNT